MELSGDRLIKAPRQLVWDALNDAEVLMLCIPGCEELTRQSDNEFVGKVVARLGPVKARFKGQIILSEVISPESYRLTGKGNGGVSGFANGAASVCLHEEADGATRLSYELDTAVGGKLAQIGQRLVKSSMQKLADQFFDQLQIQLEGDRHE